MSNSVSERQERIEKLVEALAVELNCTAIDEEQIGKIISETVMKEHRTIQQTFWKTIQKSIVHYGRYATVDARNEGSRTWANEAGEVDGHFPFI